MYETMRFESAKNFLKRFLRFSHGMLPIPTYSVIHERGISELLFAATHYTHCHNILISNFENNYN
jgi:hypothetical protein